MDVSQMLGVIREIVISALAQPSASGAIIWLYDKQMFISYAFKKGSDVPVGPLSRGGQDNPSSSLTPAITSWLC